MTVHDAAITAGFWLSGLVAIAIIAIGTRFLFAPYAAAAGYGVDVAPDPRWSAFLSAKAIRDIASGLFTALLMASGSPRLLGCFILIATIIPLVDAVIVLRHGGSRFTAFGVHGGTAALMFVTCGLLLLG